MKWIQNLLPNYCLRQDRQKHCQQIPQPIHSKDIPGADVELPQKTESPLSENTESGFLPYSLRSSSYKQPFRAERELAEIRQMGLTPYLVRADLGDMGVWWRVYIGFYSTDEEARKA